MLSKKQVLVMFLASTPFVFAAPSLSFQDDKSKNVQLTKTSKPVEATNTAPTAGEVSELRARLERAERRAEEASRRAQAAEQRAEQLNGRLEESLDLLVEHSDRRRRSNCTPSRARSLLTYYQWMDQRGYQKRAGTMLEKAIKAVGDDTNRLNHTAWNLMTEKSTEGKLDHAALALVKRMEQKNKKLSYRMLDTVALAYFLNGYVDQAIANQKKALARGGDSDEFRRRLRIYETCKKVAAKAQPRKSTATEIHLTAAGASGGE